MTSSTETQTSLVEGIGLITGIQSQVKITPLQNNEGVIFVLNGQEIPCKPEQISSTDRGVVLMHNNQPLMLIEHFLAAAAMLRHLGWKLEMTGAPELPILDGSAQGWVNALEPLLPSPVENKKSELSESVLYQVADSPKTSCLAIPNKTGFEVSCLIDFDHPDLNHKWLHFGANTNWLKEIAPARTFGFVRELPELQARGLAKGVSLNNTIGLTDEGGYTSPLRMADECVRHKVLDFIGDMALWGIDLLGVNASFVIRCSGHSSHYQFAKELVKNLKQ